MQEASTVAAGQTHTVTYAFGIQLIGDGVEWLRDKDAIELSSGIVRARSQYDSLPYWEGAFVPKLPWRKPSNAELDLLLGLADTAQPGKWIQIIRIPEEIIHLFEDAQTASKHPTDHKLREYTAGSECREAIRKTVDYARSLTWPEHPKIDRSSVFFKSPGLPTTTPRKYPELLGLHIDSAFQDVSFDQRNYAPVRISINLGLDDRFLLFVSASMDQIHQMLAERNLQYRMQSSIATHEFRTVFMDNFPDFPVVKVRIRPGEAYLAPTENVIHDGCTAGQTHFDVQFSACGHFRPQCSSLNVDSAAVLSAKLLKNERAAPLQTSIMRP